MPKSWRRVKLGEVLKVFHGYAFPGEGMSEALTGNPIIVSIGNFDYRGGFRFNSTRVRQFNGDYPQQFNLSPGDLLVAMTCQTPGGEILGLPGLVPDDGRTYLHNQRIGKVIIDPTFMNVRYAYYCFLRPDVNRQLVTTASGTKILHTAPSRISAVEIDLPSLEEQEAIADVLGSLDNKVEINGQINRIECDIAEASYVRLQQQEDAALQKVPIGDLLDLKYGKALPAIGRSAGQIPVYGSGGIAGTHNQALVEGPGIIVGRKGTVGAVYWSEKSFFPIDTTFYVEIRRHEIPMEFAYFALKQLGLDGMNSDSAVPGLNRANALALQVKVPGDAELGEFSEMVRSLFSQREALSAESENLVELRDVILPKLMSGEIRVREAGKIVEEVT